MNTPIDVTGVTLRTERLLLRPWRQEDLLDFFEYASVEGVGQMAGWLPHKSVEESQRILNSFISHKKTFALEYEGKVIGSLGIEEYQEAHFPELAEKKCRELGFVLSKAYWGRGLMTEAVRETIRWLFTDVGLDAIVCAHRLDNTRSAAVQRKCGFRFHGYSQRTTYYGETVEDAENVLHREMWEEQQ